MAKAGDTLDNGQLRLRFLQTTADTKGALVEVEATYRPGSKPPPNHVHPGQEELFEIVEGALHFEVAGVLRVVKAGDRVVVPVAAPHRAWNAEGRETRVVWQTRPALQTEALFETLAWLNESGRLTAGGRPGLLQSAVFLAQYRDTFRPTKPGPIVQSCVIGLLAPLARALGVRAHPGR